MQYPDSAMSSRNIIRFGRSVINMSNISILGFDGDKKHWIAVCRNGTTVWNMGEKGDDEYADKLYRAIRTKYPDLYDNVGVVKAPTKETSSTPKKQQSPKDEDEYEDSADEFGF